MEKGHDIFMPQCLFFAGYPQFIHFPLLFSKKKDHPMCALRGREDTVVESHFLPAGKKISEACPSSRACAGVHRTPALKSVRLPLLFSKKKDHPMGGLSFWSRIRESNPPSRLGKPSSLLFCIVAKYRKTVATQQLFEFL